jgi:hypothetical protein
LSQRNDSAEEDQARLLARIIREHAQDPHQGVEGPRLRLHAAIHTVVETQIAAGTPPEVAQTLERLTSQGLDRHQAIHAIGRVVSEELLDLLGEGQTYDEQRYVQRLRSLEPDPDLDSVPDPDGQTTP